MIAGFQQLKEFLLYSFGLSRDALHVHIGLVLYFGLHMLLRRRLGSFWPPGILLALCLAGEFLDYAYIMGHTRDYQLLSSVHDVWNTMFWPILFTVYGRWGRRPAAAAAPASVVDGEGSAATSGTVVAAAHLQD